MAHEAILPHLVLVAIADKDFGRAIDLFFNDRGKSLQDLQVACAEMARLLISDAKGANVEAVGAGERHAGVEPQMRFARHHGVSGKARVFSGVWNDEGLVLEDGVTAKRLVAVYFARHRSDHGLEPLAVGVDQGDVGHGYVEDLGELSDVAVVALLRRRVEDLQGMQRLESFLLIQGFLRLDHLGLRLAVF